MWKEMLQGWVDLACELTVLLGRIAIVAGSAMATYTMMTKGMNG